MMADEAELLEHLKLYAGDEEKSTGQLACLQARISLGASIPWSTDAVACERTGDIHPDGRPEDVLVVLASLRRIPPDQARTAQAERRLALLFRGLGAAAPATPPETP